MGKFFGLFTKKKRNVETFDNISFDQFPIQVYKHYEFDSGHCTDGCADDLSYDVKNTCLNLKPISEQQKISTGNADKSRKSMYVINISNCKNFLVGSRQIINVSSNNYIEKNLPMDFNLLLDCEERISDQSIMVISLYIGSNWEKFGESLGFKGNYLEELKCRNNEDTTCMTFDILQKYVSLFPNTSVGFIVSILIEIKEIKIISEIARTLCKS